MTVSMSIWMYFHICSLNDHFLSFFLVYFFNSCIAFVSFLCVSHHPVLNDVLLVFAEGTQEVFSLPLQVCTKVQASYETLPSVEMLFFFNAKCFETKGP